MDYNSALEKAMRLAKDVGEPYVVIEMSSMVNSVIKPVVLFDYHTMCIHSWGILLQDPFHPDHIKIHTVVNPDGTVKH